MSVLIGQAYTMAHLRKTELPNYPWQKEYYWPDESRGKSLNNTVEKRNGQLAHPFLAKKTELPEEDGTAIWESFINTLNFPI